jgi:hypothetical protein
MHPKKQFMWWEEKTDLTANRKQCFMRHFMLLNLTMALSAVSTRLM